MSAPAVVAVLLGTAVALAVFLWFRPVPVWAAVRLRGAVVAVEVGLGWPRRLALRRRRAWVLAGYGLCPPRLELEARPGGRRLVVASGDARRWRAFLRRRPWAALARRLRLVALEADVRVGTGEAATTALAAGALLAALEAARVAAGGGDRSRLRVRPDYRGARLVGRARCIGLVPAGDIITAGLLALRDRVSRNLVRGAASPRAGGRSLP